MPDTGFLEADSAVSATGPGGSPVAWSPDSGLTTKTATFVSSGPTLFSDYFQFTDFDVDAAGVGVNDVIVGVEVETQANPSLDGPAIAALEVRLIVGGVAVGDTQTVQDASTVASPGVEGASNYLWGLALTAAQVRATTFGVQVLARVNGSGVPEVASFRIKVYYEHPTVTANVTTSMVVGDGFTTTDVASSMVVALGSGADVTTSMVVGLGLQITSPSSGETLTDAEVDVTWELFPGVQTDYRIRVYSDPSGTVLVYDSGIVGSTIQGATIPAGALPSPATLYIKVNVSTATLNTAESSLVPVFTDFAPSIDIENVVTRPVGGCDDPANLPAIRISWDEVDPDVGETFVSYDVRRRVAGDTDFVRVAQIQTQGTTYYIDTQVKSREVYEYAVVWQAATGVSSLISNNQSPLAIGRVVFDFPFIHDPVDGKYIRLDALDAAIEVNQDVKLVQPWGRPTPTVHYGETFHHRLSIPLFTRYLRRPEDWQTLETLMQRKRVLCLRLGVARELYFVSITAASKRHGQLSYDPSLSLTEVFYDEAV